MKKTNKNVSAISNLRQKAEKLVKKKSLKTGALLSETETIKLVHELQVHQIELELMVEELGRSKEETELVLQKYTELYDFAPSGYFTLTKEGVIVELNFSGANLLGKERLVLINSIFTFFVSDDTKALFHLFLQKVFSKKTKQTCQVVLFPHNMQPINVFIKGDVSKNGEHCILNAFDITKQVQVEKALRVSEENNRINILQTAMDGFWLLDRKGNILEVNQTYCSMSAYTSDELLGMHISDLDVKENKSEIEAHLLLVKDRGEHRFETKHRRRDGSLLDVEISALCQNEDKIQFVVFIHDISQRKKADLELRQSEERYRALFKANHSVMLIIDPETGEIKDANPAATKYYGWPYKDFCSKNISDINVLSKADLKKEMLKAKNEKRNHFVFQHRLASNEIRDVEVFSGPISFNQSKYLYSIVHDITERVQIEQALRDSELKFRKYIDYAPHGVFVTNEKGQYTEANFSAVKFTGYSKEELLSMKITDIVPKEAISDAFLHFTKVEKEGYAKAEFPILRKDKSLGYWTVDAVKLSDKLFLGFVVDITERKQAEQALRESEQRYRSLFEESNDAIFLTDMVTGKYIDCNRMAETLTGFHREELIQMKKGSLLPPPRKGELVSNMSVLKSGKILQKETEILTSDGNFIPVEFSASIVSINNRPYILSLIHDIRKRKKIEMALQKSEESIRLKLQSILSPEGSIADLELNDIIDAPSIQKMMSSFYELVQIPMAINDMKGEVLVGIGWQDICTKFHRIHPKACRNCFESDVHLTKGIPDGEFMLNKCKNNMWDMATPIVIGGEHKGNLYMGQFFFDDEPVDIEIFRKQASQYGFDESEYMKALASVPHLNRKKLDIAKEFFLNFAGTISQLSYSNIKLARAIEQQKKDEYTLRESESNFKNLIWNLQVGVLLHGPQSEIILSNPKASELLGFNEELLKGRLPFNSKWMVIDEDGLPFPIHEQPVAKAIATKKHVRDTVVGMYHQELKQVVWLLVQSFPLLNSDGTIKQIITTFTDITKMKEAESELLQSEQRLRFHFENSPLGVVEWDANFTVTQWSKEAENLFGWQKEEILGRRLDSLHIIFEDDLPDVSQTIETLKSARENMVVRTNRNYTKAGKVIDCTWYNSVLTNKNGEMNSVLSLVQDITLRKQAENALIKLNEELEDRVKARTAELLKSNNEIKLAEEKYRTLANYNYHWETWLNPEGKYIYVSPSCLRITGYDVQEFTDDAALFYKIAHPDDKKMVRNHFHVKIKGEAEDVSFDFRIITKSGEERWISHFCRSVYNGEGKWLGQRASNSDITARKKAESFLINSHAKLRALTRRMNEIVENERKNIAREIHDELGHVLTALKYDIDNLLKNKDLTVKDVKEELPLMISMVESLIDSVRKIATELRPGILDHLGLFPAIEWQINQFSMLTKIRCEYFPEELDLEFNKNETTSIFRILQELLTNVARHSKAKKLEVQATKLQEEFLLRVKDDGVGFNVTGNFNSKSLGLIGMQERALSIGGRINVESSPGEGTCVSFLLKK